jgi:1,4-alpha-glucan branching enzyme
MMALVVAALREKRRGGDRPDAPASAADQAVTRRARLGALDAHLLAWRHWRSWEQLGAHAEPRGGTAGASFVVWAPNARRVSAIGDWNGWDGRADPLHRRDDCGIWEGFVAGPGHGSLYKFEIEGADGVVEQKTDPYALWFEVPPRTAARIWDAPRFAWSDHAWMEARARAHPHEAPVSIYEVHVGS